MSAVTAALPAALLAKVSVPLLVKVLATLTVLAPVPACIVPALLSDANARLKRLAKKLALALLLKATAAEPD